MRTYSFSSSKRNKGRHRSGTNEQLIGSKTQLKTRKIGIDIAQDMCERIDKLEVTQVATCTNVENRILYLEKSLESAIFSYTLLKRRKQ